MTTKRAQRKKLTYILIFIHFFLLINQSQSLFANILSRENNGLIYSYIVEDFNSDTINFKNRKMLEITTDESGLLPSDDGQFIEGSPNIPAKLIEVGIPTGSDFEISVLEAEYETVNNVDIAPIIPLQNTEKPEKPIKLSEIYKQNEFYPNSWTNSKKIVRIRNQRIARFYISIIQYNPSTHQIKRLKRIKLKLKFNRNKSNNKIFYDAHFEKFYKSRLINYEEAKGYRIDRPRNKETSERIFVNGNRWWSFRIKKTGAYYIDFNSMQNAGILENEIETNKIRMYHSNPKMMSVEDVPELSELPEIPILIESEDTYFGPGDRLIFFGFDKKGSYINSSGLFDGYYNRFDSMRTVWIAIGEQESSPLRYGPTSIEETPETQIVNSGWNFVYSTQNLIFNHKESVEDFFWDQVEEFTVYVTDPTRINDEISPNFYIQFDPNPTSVTFNDEYLSTSTCDFIRNGGMNFYSGNLSGLSMRIKAQYSGTQYFDQYDYAYNINLTAQSSKLRFGYFDSLDARFEISGFNQKPYVFDITNLYCSRMLESIQDGSNYYFVDTLKSREYYIVEESELNELTTGFKRENDFVLSNNNYNADYVIITPRELDPTRLEQIREEHSDMEVEIFYLDDIMTEFGYGNYDPTAIREFLFYAYTNWPTQPVYTVLIGDGHYDFLHKIYDEDIMMPTPYNVSKKSDGYFGSFSRGSFSVIMGRIPAKNQNHLDQYTEKLDKYLDVSNDGYWKMRVTTICDDDGKNGDYETLDHTEEQSVLWTNYIHSNYDPQPIYGVEYELDAMNQKPACATDVLEAFNQGCFGLNYAGHGSPIRWAHETFFKLDRHVPLIENGTKLPFVSAFSCYVAKYYLNWTECIAEELIRKDNSGAIATLASTAGSLPHNNRNYNIRLFDRLYNKTSDYMTVGQASYASKSTFYPGHDCQYLVFGDPALTLAYPDYSIELDAPDTLKGGEIYSIHGEVVDESGAKIDNYSAEAVIKVRDSRYLKFYTSTLPGASTYSTEFWETGKILFKGNTKIRNGEFAVEFIVPVDISEGTSLGKVMVYTGNELGDARGSKDSLKIKQGQADTTDQSGPDISFYLNSENSSFKICKNSILRASITDPNGINITGNIGSKMFLVIDEDNLDKIELTDNFVYDEGSYTTGEIEYQLKNIEPGPHTLTIIAYDNLGNMSSETINVTVQDCQDGLFDVLPYPSPFEEYTNFTFGLSSSADVIITIYTLSGQKIKEIIRYCNAPYAQVRWSGKDKNGNRIGNGTYIYHIKADFGNSEDTFKGKVAKLK